MGSNPSHDEVAFSVGFLLLLSLSFFIYLFLSEESQKILATPSVRQTWSDVWEWGEGKRLSTSITSFTHHN